MAQTHLPLFRWDKHISPVSGIAALHPLLETLLGVLDGHHFPCPSFGVKLKSQGNRTWKVLKAAFRYLVSSLAGFSSPFAFLSPEDLSCSESSPQLMSLTQTREMVEQERPQESGFSAQIWHSFCLRLNQMSSPAGPQTVGWLGLKSSFTPLPSAYVQFTGR